MACVLLTGFCHHRMTSVATTNTPTAAAAAALAAASLPIGGSYSDHRFFRYGYCWDGDEKGKKNKFTPTPIGTHKRRRLSFSPQASSALAQFLSGGPRCCKAKVHSGNFLPVQRQRHLPCKSNFVFLFVILVRVNDGQRHKLVSWGM